LKKYLLLLLLVTTTLFSSGQVEITADHFEANDAKKVTKFIGNVHMIKGVDELKASKVFVYFNEKKKPIRYEAIGSVKFTITMNDGKIYRGQSGRLVYIPKTEIYELYESVKLFDIKLDRTLIGEKVFVDKQSGKARVEGSKEKPVKFIFKIEEENVSKNR